MASLHWVSEDLVGWLVEATQRRDEVAAWERTSAVMMQASGSRYEVLHEAAVATVALVWPVGPSLQGRLRDLPVRSQEVVAHGIRHGAAAALTATHLRL